MRLGSAYKVVKVRARQAVDENDQFAELITDAQATVAIAYRRASIALYGMQQLGTAAVRLLTIAKSHVAAKLARDNAM